MKKFWQRLVLFGLTGAFFVSCISCSAANTASKVPILMYHNLTNDPSAVTSMTITGERFQEDMEYLEYNGYTPLLSADLINIRAGKEAMPERPVMITFDDGYRSNYDIAYPILQKTGMKAVIALIGKSIRANDNTEANRFFLKWDEAAEMADSGLVELASHTYNLHNPQYGGLTAPDGINGIQRLKGESQARITSASVRTSSRASTSSRKIPARKTCCFSHIRSARAMRGCSRCCRKTVSRSAY